MRKSEDEKGEVRRRRREEGSGGVAAITSLSVFASSHRGEVKLWGAGVVCGENSGDGMNSCFKDGADFCFYS